MIDKLFNSKVFSVCIILIIGWLTLSLFEIERNKKSFDKEILGIEKRIQNIQTMNNELNEMISHFDNPSFLEKEARLKLNYKAPDEELIMVYRDNGVKISSDMAVSADNGILKTIFSKWKKYKALIMHQFK